MWGLEGALKVAFAKAIIVVESEKVPTEALYGLEMSKNFLKDSRKHNYSPALREQKMLLSRFYWKLAHRVYWYQLSKGQVQPVEGFIQPVPCI